MDLLYARCAGLDVHKATVVACVRIPGPGPGERRAETQTFATTLRGLEVLVAWLTTHGVTHVAMESTGVYWRPVFAVLEDTVEVLLVNARHVKMLPGRKTDVRDCEWLAQLLECGLLRGSFIPPAAVRDLRDLTRLRTALTRDRTRHVNRIAKTLELANIKLGSVITDIMGKTGRAILDALSAGITDPAQLAARAQGSIRRKKLAALREAVEGRLTPHYAFLLGQHLALIDTLDAHLTTLDTRIEAAMGPGADAVALLETMPAAFGPATPCWLFSRPSDYADRSPAFRDGAGTDTRHNPVLGIMSAASPGGARGRLSGPAAAGRRAAVPAARRPAAARGAASGGGAR